MNTSPIATPSTMDLQRDSNASEQAARGLLAFYDSVCGTTHPNNEDSVKIAPPFYGLADGVGGGAGGDIASATLLQTCTNNTLNADINSLNQDSMRALLYQADSDIKQALSEVSNGRGASTLVAAWLNQQGQGVYTWVGDARIYRIDVLQSATANNTANNTSIVHLTQLTTDHTYGNVKDQVPEGWQADDPAYMIGVGRRVVGNPECLAIQLEPNQGLLLCSDGVHKFMTHGRMCQTLEELIAIHGLQTAIAKYATQLVTLAVQLGSYDDASALVVYKSAEHIVTDTASAITALDMVTPVNDC